MTSVVWTTPLGLPIVQPYRKTKRKQIRTSLQTVFISDPNSPAEVNSAKQATAFPPNFIHSLDATHMMLTALECRTQNLTFASVHDSYWTHASTIDHMSEIIRDTFIALHSSDVLSKLQLEFKERYAGYKIPLASLGGASSLMMRLRDAGTVITTSPEQAKSLAAACSDIKHIAKVSETEKSSVEEKEIDLDGLVGTSDLEGEADTQDPEADPLNEAKLETGDIDVRLLGKFVDLCDLLPPLPQKGDFDVETIKESQYFFS